MTWEHSGGWGRPHTPKSSAPSIIPDCPQEDSTRADIKASRLLKKRSVTKQASASSLNRQDRASSQGICARTPSKAKRISYSRQSRCDRVTSGSHHLHVRMLMSRTLVTAASGNMCCAYERTSPRQGNVRVTAISRSPLAATPQQEKQGSEAATAKAKAKRNLNSRIDATLLQCFPQRQGDNQAKSMRLAYLTVEVTGSIS